MGRVNKPELSVDSRTALEKGYKEGKQHSYRQRCQIILLKSEGRDSEEVGGILGMSETTVNTWVKRYKTSGIDGLKTKAGQGRKPILTVEEDGEAVLRAIKCNRQRISEAKESFEAESNKSLSTDTLRRFLKVLADGTNA
jgi:transposase